MSEEVSGSPKVLLAGKTARSSGVDETGRRSVPLLLAGDRAGRVPVETTGLLCSVLAGRTLELRARLGLCLRRQIGKGISIGTDRFGCAALQVRPGGTLSSRWVVEEAVGRLVEVTLQMGAVASLKWTAGTGQALLQGPVGEPASLEMTAGLRLGVSHKREYGVCHERTVGAFEPLLLRPARSAVVEVFDQVDSQVEFGVAFRTSFTTSLLAASLAKLRMDNKAVHGGEFGVAIQTLESGLFTRTIVQVIRGLISASLLPGWYPAVWVLEETCGRLVQVAGKADRTG